MSDLVGNENNSEPTFNLSLPREEVAGIIVDFLGKKESLTFQESGFFNIDIHRLRQYQLILEDKVEKEHNLSLGFFEFTIHYDDGTVRKIRGRDGFDSYFEQRMVYPVNVVMQWNLVLQFPNSKTVETQKIQLSFDTNNNEGLGEVRLSIEYSNVSWGMEVISLLKNQIAKDLSLPSKVDKKYEKISQKKYLVDNSILISIIVLLLYFISIIISTGHDFTKKFSLDNSYQEAIETLNWDSSNYPKEDSSGTGRDFGLYTRDLNLSILASEETKRFEEKLVNRLASKIIEVEDVFKKLDAELLDYLLDEKQPNYSPLNIVFYNQQFSFISDDQKEKYLKKILTNPDITSLYDSVSREYYFLNFLQNKYSEIISSRFLEIKKRGAYFIYSAILFIIILAIAYEISRWVGIFYSRKYIKFNNKGAFITITDLSVKRYKDFLESKSKLEFTSIKTLSIGILTGLATSAIYTLITALTAYYQ